MTKILINKSILIVCSLLFSNLLSSQGLIESPLNGNGVLIKKWNELQEQSSNRTTPVIIDTITLGPKGFLDDFSYEGPYPDTALWIDDFVFINRGYPIAPITIGAATFDGLNANGYPYDFTAGSNSSGPADVLTSKPIDLNKPVSDSSIYFSFYYQPQGRGNAPNPPDSLVLEFKGTGGWKHIWAKKGSTLASSDSSWKLVMIPITDPTLLIKGFQFRFRNYATLCGNLDHWSIDYVYLNKIRNQNDTTFEDIAFVYNTPSLLKTYSAMPWNHYNNTFTKSNLPIAIRNNHSAPKFIDFSYKIYDASKTVVNTPYSGGASTIDPYITNGYMNYPAFTNPTINYTFPSQTSTTKYIFEAIINSTPDKKRENDTLKHTQIFSNYYSYDDGSAEIAFALGGYVGAVLAEQFTSTIPDTLRCIDIYFNPQITNATLFTFRLKVWNDNGGKPGTAIFTSNAALSPIYNQTGHDQFTRYYLDSPLYLSAGTFYIGFQQNTTQFLGVGVDKNSNTQYKIFYNTSGTWKNAPDPGSLMMHPVFGSAASFVGIDDVKKQNNLITVYPNPANDKLYIRSNYVNISEKIKYTIVDVFGRTILENNTTTSEYIDISTISEGVYFIRITEGVNIFTEKFIKID